MDSKGRTPLRLETVRDGKLAVVHAIGELDLATADLLEQEIGRANDSDAEGIVLDLSGLEFIDSVGIALLLRLDAESRQNGDRFRVVRGSQQVQRILELTGVDRQLRFVPAAN